MGGGGAKSVFSPKLELHPCSRNIGSPIVGLYGRDIPTGLYPRYVYRPIIGLLLLGAYNIGLELYAYRPNLFAVYHEQTS